jgi:hypothetical protein
MEVFRFAAAPQYLLGVPRRESCELTAPRGGATSRVPRHGAERDDRSLDRSAASKPKPLLEMDMLWTAAAVAALLWWLGWI